MEKKNFIFVICLVLIFGIVTLVCFSNGIKVKDISNDNFSIKYDSTWKVVKNDKELSYKELVAKRDELKREYMDLRFKMVISHVDNPMQKRTMRREIARLNTFIQQKKNAEDNK